MLDQGRQKGLRYKKGIYANRTDIYENRILGLYGIARKGRKKEYSEKTDKDSTTDKNSTDSRKAYQVTPTPVPHTSPKRRSTDTHSPPPPILIPYPCHAHPLSTSTHATGPQRSAHIRSLLGPHTARGPFSVLQPCESHVVLILAVIPGPPCLSTRCRSTHRPIPRSVAGPMPPL